MHTLLIAPHLTERYATTLEDAPLESSAYDLIVSFNVLEHVANPAPLMANGSNGTSFSPFGMKNGAITSVGQPQATCCSMPVTAPSLSNAIFSF